MNDTPIQLTSIGYKKLLKELDQLKNKKRPATVKRLSIARDQGDLSENAGYHSAKQELEILDNRLEELEAIIQTAQVVNNKNKQSVDLGSEVLVQSGKKKQTYSIVSKFEADPINGQISPDSPLGQALMGRKVGDQVKVNAPAGVIKYTIKKIK
jgi:transcription elongation factor GreA